MVHIQGVSYFSRLTSRSTTIVQVKGQSQIYKSILKYMGILQSVKNRSIILRIILLIKSEVTQKELRQLMWIDNSAVDVRSNSQETRWVCINEQWSLLVTTINHFTSNFCTRFLSYFSLLRLYREEFRRVGNTLYTLTRENDRMKRKERRVSAS